MKTRVTPALMREATTFAFRFACDDCVHFAPEAPRCGHAYPLEPRADVFAKFRTASGTPSFIAFCKEFELA